LEVKCKAEDTELNEDAKKEGIYSGWKERRKKKKERRMGRMLLTNLNLSRALPTKLQYILECMNRILNISQGIWQSIVKCWRKGAWR
jgi:hypothetical protein